MARGQSGRAKSHGLGRALRPSACRLAQRRKDCGGAYARCRAGHWQSSTLTQLEPTPRCKVITAAIPYAECAALIDRRACCVQSAASSQIVEPDRARGQITRLACCVSAATALPVNSAFFRRANAATGNPQDNACRVVPCVRLQGPPRGASTMLCFRLPSLGAATPAERQHLVS